MNMGKINASPLMWGECWEFEKKKGVERCIYDLHRASLRVNVLNMFYILNVFEGEIVSWVVSCNFEPLELMIDTKLTLQFYFVAYFCIELSALCIYLFYFFQGYDNPVVKHCGCQVIPQ